MELIVGTAGHIDHGKTSLVKALTGIDADRLPEEKSRGITIDIGFAEMTIGGRHIAFVDVPGHERFVKNMLAGASGVDAVLLVVAADDGVMPQTREHFEICRLLGITAGAVVLTKIDLCDAETVELAQLEIADLVEGSFLENAPVFCVSSSSGQGVEELRSYLENVAPAEDKVRVRLVARLPIDRVFSVKGFGTVVTGTLISGELHGGAEVDLLGAGKRTRIRGLESHGKPRSSADHGSRVAVNLAGVETSHIERGMILAEPGTLKMAQVVDVEITVLADARPLRSRQRVRVHIGTAEILARIQVLNATGEIPPGERGFAQLRLESPTACIAGERFIVRAYSPQMTIAGGFVIDNAAQRHRKSEFLGVNRFLSTMLVSLHDPINVVAELIDRCGIDGTTFSDIQARTGYRSEVLRSALDALAKDKRTMDCDGIFVANPAFEKAGENIVLSVETFHKREPLVPGTATERLRNELLPHGNPVVFDTILKNLVSHGKLTISGEIVSAASHQVTANEEENRILTELRSRYEKAGLEVPRVDDVIADVADRSGTDSALVRKLLLLLVAARDIVKVSDEFYFAGSALAGLIQDVRSFADTTTDRVIDMPTFKEIAGVSRKFAIPLLEYFDGERVTVRRGDKRVVI